MIRVGGEETRTEVYKTSHTVIEFTRVYTGVKDVGHRLTKEIRLSVLVGH